ncbi:MAG: flagellar hook-basal body complex protein FliE [Campylobacterota bacterium]|nr:flagellar hook-basal body complex protein FliE [Campylobacterota bacterium]
MADINNISSLSTADLLKKGNSSSIQDGSNVNFADQLKSAINEVNTHQVEGEHAMADMATGQVKDLHQAALAISKAETSMKLMLEVRNKALSAYKEITRTQL